jgi:hypothetical protein
MHLRIYSFSSGCVDVEFRMVSDDTGLLPVRSLWVKPQKPQKCLKWVGQ